MEYRDKPEWTFGEAMLHLNRVFNKEVFGKLNQAIRKEIEDAKQNAIASCNDA